jgi:hypothetical protein
MVSGGRLEGWMRASPIIYIYIYIYIEESEYDLATKTIWVICLMKGALLKK